MEMKIIPANGGGPGMNGVFLSGYGDGDYTPRPRSGPLPSLHSPDVEKTSFITLHGLYYYNVIPFDLKNTGATYQRMVTKVF